MWCYNTLSSLKGSKVHLVRTKTKIIFRDPQGFHFESRTQLLITNLIKPWEGNYHLALSWYIASPFLGILCVLGKHLVGGQEVILQRQALFCAANDTCVQLLLSTQDICCSHKSLAEVTQKHVADLKLPAAGAWENVGMRNASPNEPRENKSHIWGEIKTSQSTAVVLNLGRFKR